MRVHVLPASNVVEGSVHELMLEPEDETDARKLESLVDGYKLVGFGRCPGSGFLTHVRLPLVCREW